MPEAPSPAQTRLNAQELECRVQGLQIAPRNFLVGLAHIPSRLQLEITDEKAGALQGENHFPREPPATLARTASSFLREYAA